MKRLLKFLTGLIASITGSGKPPGGRKAPEAKNPFTPLCTAGSWGFLQVSNGTGSPNFVELFTLGTESVTGSTGSTAAHTYLYQLEFPHPLNGDLNHHSYWKRLDPSTPSSPNLDTADCISVQMATSALRQVTRFAGIGQTSPAIPRVIKVGSGHGLRATSTATSKGSSSYLLIRTFYLSDHGDNLTYTDQ